MATPTTSPMKQMLPDPSASATGTGTGTGIGTGTGAALRIATVGTGRVGLVSAASLARLGHEVVAFDGDTNQVAAWRRGEVPGHEPGLQALVLEESARGRLVFTDDPGLAFAHADLVFVTVGALSQVDGTTSTAAIDTVTALLCTHLDGATVVALMSSVPVGTASRMQAAFDAWHANVARGAGAPRVVTHPGFLREGSACDDFMHPDRLIFGSDEGAPGGPVGPALALLKRAYAPLIDAGVPVVAMDTRSAELAHCATNAMLAVRISFINEIAAIAHATGADIECVRAGIGSDKRIGPHALDAGLGYGGSCFPDAVAALRHAARHHQLRADMLAAAERVNGRQRGWPLDALRREVGGWPAVRGLRVALWGLASKPGSADMREAPSLLLIDRLRRAGAQLSVYDPQAMPNARACVGAHAGIRWCESAEAALANADTLMLVTEWPEFMAFEPRRVASSLRLRCVFDGRNALDAEAWNAAGLRLFQVGRPGLRRPAAAPKIDAQAQAQAHAHAGRRDAAVEHPTPRFPASVFTV